MSCRPKRLASNLPTGNTDLSAFALNQPAARSAAVLSPELYSAELPARNACSHCASLGRAVSNRVQNVAASIQLTSVSGSSQNSHSPPELPSWGTERILNGIKSC